MFTNLRKTSARGGFTLVELLIVIGIIGILAGLLSTAILNIMKSANKGKNEADAQMLKAAIVEFWHDNNRWPIPETIDPIYEEGYYNKDGSGSASSASGDTFTGYSYKIKLRENNNEVIQELLSATDKSYIELKGLMSPVEANLTKNQYPCGEICDAGLLAEGEATYSDPGSPNYGNKIPPRKYPVIAYRSEILKCPECDAVYVRKDSRKYCTNKKCPSYDEDKGNGRRFTASERRHPLTGGTPFTIEINLDDNTCTVSMD